MSNPYTTITNKPVGEILVDKPIELQTIQIDDTPLTDLDPSVVEQPSFLKRGLGLGLIFTASIIFTFTSSLSKYLSNIPSGEYVANRGFFSMLLLIPFMLHQGIDIFNFPKKKMVLLRCVSHGTAYCLKIWCVKEMRMGDALALYFTGPIFAGIFARIFLKEKYTITNVLATLGGITGIFLVSKPGFIFGSITDLKPANPFHCMLAVVAAFLLGVGYFAQRSIGKDVHVAVTTLWMQVWVFIGGNIVILATEQDYVLPSCFDDRLYLALAGVLACVGLVILNIGLSIERSAPATLMRNMDIVLAFVVQVVLFKNPTDWMSVLGAGLIVGGTVSVTLETVFCANNPYAL